MVATLYVFGFVSFIRCLCDLRQRGLVFDCDVSRTVWLDDYLRADLYIEIRRFFENQKIRRFHCFGRRFYNAEYIAYYCGRVCRSKRVRRPSLVFFNRIADSVERIFDFERIGKRSAFENKQIFKNERGVVAYRFFYVYFAVGNQGGKSEIAKRNQSNKYF